MAFSAMAKALAQHENRNSGLQCGFAASVLMIDSSASVFLHFWSICNSIL